MLDVLPVLSAFGGVVLGFALTVIRDRWKARGQRKRTEQLARGTAEHVVLGADAFLKKAQAVKTRMEADLNDAKRAIVEEFYAVLGLPVSFQKQVAGNLESLGKKAADEFLQFAHAVNVANLKIGALETYCSSESQPRTQSVSRSLHLDPCDTLYDDASAAVTEAKRKAQELLDALNAQR